jgi:3-oxosteroid 1-dehydrogenase
MGSDGDGALRRVMDVGDGMIADGEFDVVVVGSGAGGMLCAVRAHDLGLKVLLIEKSHRYGGTSAISGGAIWVPGSHLAGTDTAEAGLAYLKAVTRGTVPEAKLARYVDAAPELLRYLEGVGVPYCLSPAAHPDYYPNQPGWSGNERNLFCLPFNGKLLGDVFFEMREGNPEAKLLGRISLDHPEIGKLLVRARGWKRLAIRQMGRYALDLVWRWRTYRDSRLTLGHAMIGRLRKAMLDRDIPLLLKTPLTGLVTEDERVVGVRARLLGNETNIRARLGVVLASGGFEHSQPLRDQYLEQPTDVNWTATPRSENNGDGLRAALAVGAATEFTQEAWWAPTTGVPSPGAPSILRNRPLMFERAFPHTICVNRLGRRFVNETCSYHQFGQAMLADNRETGANLPCWMIFDAQYRHKYPLAGMLPGYVMPDRKLPKDYWGAFLIKADSIAELAVRIEVPADALEASVSRYNRGAAEGRDEEFGRGENGYSQRFGDPKQAPNRNIGPIDRAPYYAIRVDLGDIGTKGGPKTDEHARVMDMRDRPIAGLYAIGNVAGSVMGDTYPGAGATLGPAMTFGYVAAGHMADAAAAGE